MLEKLKYYWEMLQSFLDVSGDTMMCIFTCIILYRLFNVMHGSPALTASEAATYSAAIAVFGYSNTRGPKV